MSDQPKAQPAPDLRLPKGNECCDVSIIDSTCTLVVPPSTLIEPAVEGQEWLNMPDYAFYIKHQRTGTQVMFDMGTRFDWENSVPHVFEVLSNRVPGMKVETEVYDILKEGGVNPDDLKAFILSHWHFDHTGNIARLSPKTDLIVGPGFKNAFEPGYPANADSAFHEADFKGRNVIEPDFNLQIGNFQGHDYFGDGSLYVLNVPGHTTGHISALVRTTPETFVFLGGDACHFTGMMRPSGYIPLPDPIPSQTPLDKRLPSPCPCSIFTACHPDQKNARVKPFFRASTGGPYGSWYDDPELAMKSITTLRDFDANPNVLMLIAHDASPRESLVFFPKGTVNDWQSKGSKQEMHWYFVNELPVNGKQERNTMNDGLYRDLGDGKGLRLVKTLKGENVS